MHEIRMPQLNNNDETGILDRWLVEDGAPVTADTVIAVVETSKASYDLMSEADGILRHLVEEGEERPIGELIARVFADDDERRTFLARRSDDGAADPTAPAGDGTGELVITRGARELIAKAGISAAELAGLGKKVIRRADLDPLLQARPAGPEPAAGEGAMPAPIALPRRQRAIAETVSRSHAAIPRAFTAIKVVGDAALGHLAELTEREETMIGFPELLIRILGALRDAFPFFYGQLLADGRFQPAPAPDVGVTIDVGRGLFIPVVRSPASRSIAEIAEILMEFRIKALRDTFRQEELSGGAITLSLNNDPDVLLTEPLILPGQSCMVSLGSFQTELVRTADGAIAERRVCYLGLSYDHRVINGSDTVGFLQAVKQRVESTAGEEVP